MFNVDYVRELMDAHGWSLGQLSARTGVSKAQLSRLLREERQAGAKTMNGIIKAFPEADVAKFFCN